MYGPPVHLGKSVLEPIGFEKRQGVGCANAEAPGERSHTEDTIQRTRGRWIKNNRNVLNAEPLLVRQVHITDSGEVEEREASGNGTVNRDDTGNIRSGARKNFNLEIHESDFG